MNHLRLFFCIILIVIISSNALLDLTKFSDQTAVSAGARCLDGTPSGYYIETGAVTNKWVISLEGGAFCTTVDECNGRLSVSNQYGRIAKTKQIQNSLGSSNYFPSTYEGFDVTYGGRSNRAAEANPGFWNWTRVRIPYCSGDIWSGTRTDTESAYNGVYFSGHLTVKAVIEELISKYSLDTATELIFTGESAGALGATANVDWVSERLPNTSIAVLLNAGWFIPYPPFSNSILPLEDLIRNNAVYFHSRFNQKCTAANPNNASFCVFPEIAYQYIPNRLFTLQSVIDSSFSQYLGLALAPGNEKQAYDWTVGLGNSVHGSLDKTVDARSGSGGVTTTCFLHIVPWVDGDFQLDGHYSSYYAMNWYYNLTDPHFVSDGCDLATTVDHLIKDTSLAGDCKRLRQICSMASNIIVVPFIITIVLALFLVAL